MPYSGARPPFFIGISGGTASGKARVCSKIMGYLTKEGIDKQVVMISQASFYKELDEEDLKKVATGDYDFDHPDAFDTACCIDTLKRLKAGQVVEVPEYDPQTCRRKGVRRVAPADVILVEGILLFYDPALRDLFDMKVFVHTDSDIRLMHRVERDTIVHKRELKIVLHHYMQKVKPSFESFCLPTKKYADVIIPRGSENEIAIELLFEHIQDILRTPESTPRAQSHEQLDGDEIIYHNPRPAIGGRPH